jgi:Uma2 family endonuclease
MLARSDRMTYKEFLDVESQRDDVLEFIDGHVYMQASPSVSHQRILLNIATEMKIYFKGKQCEPFIAPFDVVFEGEEEKHKVQPDLTVICDKSGLNKNNYIGVPSLVVEVLSPSTSSRDYIQKMNLYMRFGVEEYWIVSPKNKEIQVFTLEDNVYKEHISYYNNATLKSSIFHDLEMNLDEIF